MKLLNLNKNNLSIAALICLALVLFFGYFYISRINAQASSIISIQGKIVNLTDGTNVVNGSPACVNAAADTCDFRVNIYSEETGGTLLWQEPHVNVEIGENNGIFDLSLNSVCNSWESPAGVCSGSGVNWGSDSTIYFEIEFDPDGSSDTFAGPIEMFERSLITSVPFAYYAEDTGAEFEDIYQNDVDKTITIDNVAGLSFDLISTGTLGISENGTAFFTFNTDNSITYSPDDTSDIFTISNGNLQIGDATPGLTLDGEDAFIEGTLEVDSNVDFGSDVNFNNNEAIGFRVENANGSISVPTCSAATQGRHYYDVSDDNAYVCIESSPSTYSWFNLTQTFTATATKVVTVGTTGDYASIAAAAGYLNTLTGGIMLLAPQTHNVANPVDLENITLIGANIEDTVINITGSGSLRSRQTQFSNLTVNVDAGITNTSGIDALLEIGANSTIIFDFVDFNINGAKFLLDSTEATAPTIEVRFENSSATVGTGSIVPTISSANLNSASSFKVSLQGDNGALNFADWDIDIAGSGNVITTGAITTVPENTIFIYPGMNIQGAVDSLPNGGFITLLPGIHNITQPISILNDNIRITGYGDASIISASGFTGGDTVAVIHLGAQNGSAPVDSVQLSDFKVEVSGTGSSDIHGIRVAGGSDNSISNVTVQKISGQSGTGTGARIGIFLIDGTTEPLVRGVIKDSRVIGNGGTNYFTDGIHVTGGQDYGFAGIFMNGQGIQNVLVEGNNVDFVRETAAVFIGVEDSSMFNNRFSRMGVGSANPFGIFMGNSQRVAMTNNIITGTSQVGSIGIGIDAVTPAFGPTFSDSTFTGNVIDGSSGTGVGFATGFSIGNGTNATVERLIFLNNIVNGASTSAGVAFDIDGEFDNNIISNNTIDGINNTWTTGINVQDTTAESNILRGNIFNNTINNIADSGTDTKFGVAQHQSTLDPTATDDNTSGYDIGTLWINILANTAFINLDNATGAAIWQTLGSGSGTSSNAAYGELFVTGNAAADTFGTTYTVLDVFDTVGVSNNVTVDTGVDTLTIAEAGTYYVTFSLSAIIPFTDDVDVSLFINGVQQGQVTSIQGMVIAAGGAPSQNQNLSSGGLFTLSAGDVLDVRGISNDGATSSVTITDGTFSAFSLSGTLSSGPSTSDLEDIYANDADKILNISDVAGLRFDLISTGDFNIAENGTAFFTFNPDNSIVYNPDDPTDLFQLSSGNLQVGTGSTPDIALNGESVFIEGSLEVDGTTQLDGTTITIGSGTSTSVSIQDDNFSVDASGDATFNSVNAGSSFSGAGLVDCDASIDKLTYDIGTGQFICSTDGGIENTFEVYDSVGNLALTGAGVVVNMDTIRKDFASNYTLLNDEITIADAGLYQIGFECSTNLTGGGRDTTRCYLELDTGGGFAEIPGSQCFNYNRNAANGEDSCSRSIIDNLPIGSTIRLVALEVTAATAVTIPEASSIQITKINETGADLAEVYYTDDSSIEAGDVVSIDPTIDNGIQKSTHEMDKNVLGVISTNPGLVLGEGSIENENRPVFLGLSGRVPVKVTTSNGSIEIGDYLTSSAMPGVAMKLTGNGYAIGQALSEFSFEDESTTEAEGVVMMFIKNDFIIVEENELDLDTTIENDESKDNEDQSEEIQEEEIESLDQEVADSSIESDNLAEEETSNENNSESLSSINLEPESDSSAEIEVINSSGEEGEKSEEVINAVEIEDVIDLATISDLTEPEVQETLNFETQANIDLLNQLSFSQSEIKIDLQIEGSLIVSEGLFVDGDSEFLNKVIFSGEVAFDNNVIFNTSMGGIVDLEAGTKFVYVEFKEELLVKPVITITQVNKTEESKGVSYVNAIVSKVNKTGFEIIIEEPNQEDISFAWTAIQVRD